MKCEICGLDSDSGLYAGQEADFWNAHLNGECLVAHAVRENLQPISDMSDLERLKQRQRKEFENGRDVDLGAKGFYNLGYVHALERRALRDKLGEGDAQG